METPAHLPSTPREFIDLSSDDEEEEDSVQELPELDPGHFPEFNDLNDLILGNIVRENQAAWDAAAFEAQGFQVPILGDWQNEAPEPVPEAINPPGGVAPGLPQMLRQAERLHLNHLPVNLLNEQQDNEQFHNDNDLIQGQVNNQLNNEQPDNEIDLILSDLNRQFPNARMEDDDNFVWGQVNRDLHNANDIIDLDPPPTEEMANKARCIQGVADIFPDICLEYVEQLYVALQGRKTSLAIIELVLEGEENGQPYPKINQLKRKRPVESDDDEEIMQKYTADRQHNSDKYLTMARGMLSEDFPSIPMSFIMKQFYDSGMVIYTAYQSLADAERVWDPNNPSYHKLKQARKVKSFNPSTVDEKLTNPETPPDQKRAYAELKDVRAGRAKWEGKLAAKMKREADAAAAKEKYEAEEAANLELAIKEGTMEECGCCFDDFPRNRMINCNNESISHYFCKRCARLHAETQIGSGKYELQCMSTDGCEADYSYAQRQLFLDANLTTALDRIAAETNLRLAGIENLASCPFCPYAAEYPPIEEERLFHCVLDSCKKISCRMCLKESHIPKTCQENAKDIGLDVRREVEEAMTAALVRLCNKCKGPFIKEDGCNKMNCPCGNIQCYVCSKSCQYNHFDDERRGGKAGNCPLFDDVQVRHEDETKRAEAIIVEKLKREHPEVDPEDLEIRVSDAVKEDEERRKKKRWNPHEPFRFAMEGGIGRPQGPPLIPQALAGNQERQAYREAYEAHMAQYHANVENLGPMGNRPLNPGQRQHPNLQDDAAVPANPPAAAGVPDKYKHVRFPRHQRQRNPAHQALYEAARARVRANRLAQDEALGAAEGGNKELRDRLAAGRKEARRGLRELVRERIAAANEAANAAAIAAVEPRRGEDGGAEVVYRPGDKVAARRRVQEWVFEPFGAPPVPEAGGEAGNAGNDGEMPLDDLVAEAYAAIGRAPRAPAAAVHNRGEAGNAGNDAGLMPVDELIAQAYAAIGRRPRAPRPVYNREDFQLFPRQQPFMLPQHPARPEQQAQPQPQQQQPQNPLADFEEFMMEQPLMDGYVEPNGQKLVPLPMKAVMDPHAVMDFEAPHRRVRANRPAAGEEGAGRRFVRVLGLHGGGAQQGG
ncbi:hypothetical protein V501_03500 [Pseudogymnoascus sp. VKM F-4519 (FW-2642)]|nr:hypothetical protein V501_03500 [Pseudogymnoascus sp. VKM F-4519 (FW-2642)]